MAMLASAAEMLPQLESARKLALGDAQVYIQIIPGILPIIGPGAPVEVRRWGADFLAEGFASPSLAATKKEELVTDVVPVLKSMLDGVGGEDVLVVRSAVMAAASIYPLVFRRVIKHPDQVLLWQDMASIKLNILQRMDSSPVPVRICCIKFVQKVVQVQTPGLIADPRRPDNNETSLALIPRNHPLLPLPNIEAETSGLTDRLLSVLQEQSGDPLLVDSTINCLAVLIKTRPAVANKILSVVLNYNPLKHAVSPLTPRSVVVLKSLERTTRALLRNVMRAYPNHPLGDKVSNYLARLQQSRTTLFSESNSLKRPAEQMQGPDEAKRPRLVHEPKVYPAMPPPPNTLAQLFTLTTDVMLQQFDVKLLPAEMVANINGLLLQHIDSKTLDEAIEVVRLRYVALQKLAQSALASQVPMDGPTGIDDEDDYDPEFIAGSDIAMAQSTERAIDQITAPSIELGPYKLPKPAPLTATEVAILSDQTVGRVFEMVAASERASTTGRQKAGLNRLAASTGDRDAWVTILIRLATRAPYGLEEYVTQETSVDRSTAQTPAVKKEPNSIMVDPAALGIEKPDMSSRIRQTLFHYILDDWRARINIALNWLTEEFYADRIALNPSPAVRDADDDSSDDATEKTLYPNYNRTLNRLLTYLLPRFDASDSKILIRFLSELPHLNADIIDQVRQLARDPGTVKICALALHYLVTFRPPVRQITLDSLCDMCEDGDDGVRDIAAKILSKWRPGFENDLAQRKKSRGDAGASSAQTNGSDSSSNGGTVKSPNNAEKKGTAQAQSTNIVVGAGDPRKRNG